MKKLLIILTVLKLTDSHAQFYAGSQGITIKSGTEIIFDNLSLRPSSDLTIANNNLQRSETAIPGNPHGSINRVYRFGSAVKFSGIAAISYQTSELNGNTESDLQILYSLNVNQGFTVTAGSTVDEAIHQVSNVLSNTDFIILSATDPRNALPVTLIDFRVVSEGGAAVLKWSTSLEINADRFIIERSINARNWVQAGWISAAEDSHSIKNYTYTDAEVTNGMNYYRLKMIDRATDTPERGPKDQSFAYSQIRSLLFSRSDVPLIFPNPVDDKLSFKNVSVRSTVKVSIYEISGHLVFEDAINPDEGLHIKDFPPGTYVLKITQENGQQSSHTFLKQ